MKAARNLLCEWPKKQSGGQGHPHVRKRALSESSIVREVNAVTRGRVTAQFESIACEVARESKRSSPYLRMAHMSLSLIPWAPVKSRWGLSRSACGKGEYDHIETSCMLQGIPALPACERFCLYIWVRSTARRLLRRPKHAATPSRDRAGKLGHPLCRPQHVLKQCCAGYRHGACAARTLGSCAGG